MNLGWNLRELRSIVIISKKNRPERRALAIHPACPQYEKNCGDYWYLFEIKLFCFLYFRLALLLTISTHVERSVSSAWLFISIPCWPLRYSVCKVVYLKATISFTHLFFRSATLFKLHRLYQSYDRHATKLLLPLSSLNVFLSGSATKYVHCNCQKHLSNIMKFIERISKNVIFFY